MFGPWLKLFQTAMTFIGIIKPKVNNRHALCDNIYGT